METKHITKRKKVGLALSGGNWRGLAHVGVFKALEKNNIPIDYIAGTSAGALIGGLYSFFGNSKDLEEFIVHFGYKDIIKIISDPKLKSGLIKGKKIIDYINKVTNNINIEDLHVPFSAVATDILTASSYYFQSGNLAEAIKTSGSIPMIFQPTFTDNMILVDGGATENVPVKCVRSMGADIVIAVSVNTAYFPIKKEEINSSTKIAIASTRSMLNTLSKILATEADIIIEPKVPRKKVDGGINYIFEFFEFVRDKDAIKIGEKATEEMINNIKSKLQ